VGYGPLPRVANLGGTGQSLRAGLVTLREKWASLCSKRTNPCEASYVMPTAPVRRLIISEAKISPRAKR